jgi:mono/diheme cytochrome c family protein
MIAFMYFSLVAATGVSAGPDTAFFENKVRPVLVEHCQKCHGPSKQQAGLRLDGASWLKKGADTGPVVVPGKPEKSPLFTTLSHETDMKMPPKGKLPQQTIDDIGRWIRDGAVWPDDGKAATASIPSAEMARKTHWAFQKVREPALPEVRNPGWVRDPLDRFVLAGLEAAKLSPAPEVDREKFIRRVSYDLVGLPPTPAEIDAFLADKKEGAHERVVDRLLADPRHGERWARHWMDLARYADTKGYVFQEDRNYAFAWTYRDWLVNSLNADMPYDRFVSLQIAADAIPKVDRKDLAALGYLTLGRRFLNNINDIIDDRIDVTMRGLQGLTMACARCHDHKFDPLSMKDYYALYGVYAGSTEDQPELEDPMGPKAEAFKKELAEHKARVEGKLEEFRKSVPDKLRKQAHLYLVAVRDLGAGEGDKALSMNLPGLIRKPMVDRWKAYLEQASKEDDEIFATWRAFAALKVNRWKEDAPVVLKKMQERAEAKKWPAPLKALVADLPQHHMALAERYKNLFEQALKEPQAADLAGVRKALVGDKAPPQVPPGEIEKFIDRAERTALQEVKKKLDEFVAKNADKQPRAMGLKERGPHNPRIFLRGNPGNPGPEVKRGFPEVVSDGKPFTQGTGRMELAQAMTSKDNPLTARVSANRMWLLHVGQAIVRTPGDFGLRGDAPTNQGLLDHLAHSFMRDGWSMKKLHRKIVLSATYRQACENPVAVVQDPDNRLFGRMGRRRLEFEALRDGMLAAAGRLDEKKGGPAVDLFAQPFSGRRSVYGFIDRQNLPGTFRTFDLASPDLATPQRHSTTVPQQALYLLNSPFSLEMARSMAARADLVNLEPTARMDAMARLAWGRHATDEEKKRALAIAQDADGWTALAQVLLCSNEFAFAD